MLRIAAVAVFGAMGALGASHALGARTPTGAPNLRPAAVLSQAAASQSEPEAEVSGRGGDASITKGPDGHYWAEADVNGHRVRFLVDTGATDVALTTTDAQRLGIDTGGLAYVYTVSTASGQARAARVQLDSVSVSGTRVRDVEALVIDHGLDVSLLGMTYLGRLSRFEATPSSLILRQ